MVDGAKYICGYYRAASVGSAGGMVKDSSVYIDWYCVYRLVECI